MSITFAALLLTATGPATPGAVVAALYDAVRRRDYAAAYRLWDEGGRASGRSLAAFRRGYADTRTATVRLGAPSTPQGAAGSSYVTVPVTVDAVATSGAHRRFAGRYVLRRSVVPLAVPGWHIASATLRRVG